MSPAGRELFVISDLHLGGVPPKPDGSDRRGFRLCTQTDALAQFILQVAGRRSSYAIELVINGDVDFLAQEDYVASVAQVEACAICEGTEATLRRESSHGQEEGPRQL